MITIDFTEKEVKNLKVFLARLLLQPYEIEQYRAVVKKLNFATSKNKSEVRINEQQRDEATDE